MLFFFFFFFQAEDGIRDFHVTGVQTCALPISGGRLVIVDSQADAASQLPATENARASQEYAAVGDQLPLLNGRSREQIVTMVEAHGLTTVGSDPLLDLVAAQEQ